MKLKGIYLIQEKGCLNTHSGAFQHIKMGVKYLSQSFHLDVYLTAEKIELSDYSKTENKKYTYTHKKEKKGWLYGTLKDLFVLSSHCLQTRKLYKLFKKKNIDFVYERASYLNYSGLIAARLAGIKHFYEANGLQFETHKKYYNSLLPPFIKLLEKSSYKKSDYNFFIGSYGDYWKIKKKNWINIENGIEEDMMFEKNTLMRINDEKTQICFIGRPMKHHGLQILIELFKHDSIRKNATLHLIGEGFEIIERDLLELNAEVINHGFKNRSEILSLRDHFDLGLILKTPEHASNMKLFDYAALGCAVLSVDSYNLNYWFKEELIFHDGSLKSIEKELIRIINDNSLLNYKSTKLREKIKREHTWNKVFEKEAGIILQQLQDD